MEGIQERERREESKKEKTGEKKKKKKKKERKRSMDSRKGSGGGEFRSLIFSLVRTVPGHRLLFRELLRGMHSQKTRQTAEDPGLDA